MNLAQRIKLENEAAELRPRVFQTCHNLAEEIKYTLNFSHHFLSRFDVRSIDPVKALTALEVLVRSFYRSPGDFKDREGVVGVDSFVFVVKSHERQGRRELVFITFWQAKSGISRLDLLGREDIIRIID